MADTPRLSDEEIRACALVQDMDNDWSDAVSIIANALRSARREGAEAMRERICAEYQRRIDHMKTNTGPGRPEFTIEFFEQRIIDIRALDPEMPR